MTRHSSVTILSENKFKIILSIKNAKGWITISDAWRFSGFKFSILCMYLCLHVYTWKIYIYTYGHTFSQVRMYVCIYEYIWTYFYTYTCNYGYMFTDSYAFYPITGGDLQRLNLFSCVIEIGPQLIHPILSGISLPREKTTVARKAKLSTDAFSYYNSLLRVGGRQWHDIFLTS